METVLSIIIEVTVSFTTANWLESLESNQDSEFQRLASYH